MAPGSKGVRVGSLLFLTQRIPYPPIKGEKIRAYRMLCHLARRHEVHLGTLIDDPRDWQHVETVRALCKAAYFAPLDRRVATPACLAGLLTGEALSVRFFRNRGLRDWVTRTLDTVRPDVVFVCSGNMAPYVLETGNVIMEDEAGGDEKIVAVPATKLTRRYEKVENYTDLPQITIDQIKHFFEHYKDLETSKWVKVVRWGDAAEAKALILEGVARAKAAKSAQD